LQPGLEDDVNQSTRVIRRATNEGLSAAVHQNKALSKTGVLERLFTFAFQHLVYPQIWEDPLVDMEALRLGPDDHVVAIASGGCNVLSYLTADPARVAAIDLNGAHIALNRLKICALKNLPDYDAFFSFFGRADSPANVAAYETQLRDKLDADSRAYWDGRGIGGKRRIKAFSDNFYRHGLLGRFIGAGHWLARLYGADIGAILKTRTIEEQRAIFDRQLAPLVDKAFVRWLARQPATLYGLGIPPSQYRALAGDSPDGIAAVLKQRVERLACGFPIQTNYFAWQAFGRRYAPGADASLPPYLQRDNFADLRERADRVRLHHCSMTAFLNEAQARSLDCYVLLDAQDWMSDADLTALWSEILRTARPGARVIFRTAADERLLPGRVPQEILDAFDYDADLCRRLGAKDRSSIYGGFHLYTLAARH
jgi:S-adenosylmethionine-diacylglycerol 3-amino-3-carboxypropyl transferase